MTLKDFAIILNHDNTSYHKMCILQEGDKLKIINDIALYI